jgi:hypothetical protein
MADALNVEPAVAITAATMPIAILRTIVLTPSLSTPAFQNQTEQFPLSCSPAAESLGVPASETELVRGSVRIIGDNISLT